MLSEHTRLEMKLLGIPAKVECRVCKKCKKTSSEIPADVAHPIEERLIKARRLLERNRRSHQLQVQMRKLMSLRHQSSRCCGYRYEKVLIDNHEPLWETWLNRHALCKVPIEQLRRDMCPRDYYDDAEPQGPFDDDFVIMTFLWGTPDHRTLGLVKLFRQEEVRQAELLIAEREVAEAIA